MRYKLADEARPQVVLLIAATIVSVALWIISWYLPLVGDIVRRTASGRSLCEFEMGKFCAGFPDSPMPAECIFQPERSFLYFHAYDAAFRRREYGSRDRDPRVSLGFHLDRYLVNHDYGRD